MIDIIKLNNRDFNWQEGMTVEDIMKIKKFSYSRIIVKINDKLIEQEDYAITVVNDGDDVKMIHLLAGG